MRSTCGDTGLVGSCADSDTSMRMPWLPLDLLASMLLTRCASAPTHASASCCASSGVPARAVIEMTTVSGVWAASMLPTRPSGEVSRPRSSMTIDAVSRSFASTTYDAARDLDSESLRLSRPGSPPPPEVTKPDELAA